MSAPTTRAEFLDLVRQSDLATTSRLDASLQRLRRGETTEQPAVLASALVQDGLLTDFQANQLLQGRARGFALGRYVILERLGVSRMSTVFLCRHQTLERLVAIKVLSHNKATNKALLQRFYREARATAILDHPHLVRAFDIEENERGHLLIMEYVDGLSLQALVDGHGPLSPLRAAHYVRQAALGLAAAHEKGIIHRDVKPANLLVDRDGVVKVLDLGLALLADDECVLTQGVLGSVDYLPPEQSVDSHTVDVRADVYGLGATFYFLLTGTPPFSGGTAVQRALAHRAGKYKPVNSFCPEIPEGLEAVQVYMMARDPEQRYPSAEAVAEALEPWTQQPIVPPTEAELPVLSPAVTRGLCAKGSPKEEGQSANATVTPPSRQAERPRRTPAPVKRASDSKPLAKVTAKAEPVCTPQPASVEAPAERGRGWWWLWWVAAAAAVGVLWYRLG